MRRTRRLSLGLVALVAGAAAAVGVPAVAPVDAAPPSAASFTAADFAWEVSGGSENAVTISIGGTVTFGYPSGGYAHNADFSDGPAPTSCTQTSGADSGPVPPLPAFPTSAGWSGSCRFDTPGRYAFHCDAHPLQMRGTVEVVDPNAPPPTTTSPGPAPPTGTTPAPGGGGAGGSGTPPSHGSPGSSTAPSLLPRVSARSRQTGSVLHGVVTTPAGRSRIVVTALVSNRALSKRPPKHVRKVPVGSLRTRSTGTGRTSFAVTLSRAARRALKREGHLAVTLRIVVKPAGGRPVGTTVAVVVRAASPSA